MKNMDDYYENNYDKVLNTGLVGKMSGFVHWLTEKSVPIESYKSVLELGAGAGQHKFFLKNTFQSYHETDLRVKENSRLTALIMGRSVEVSREYADAQELTEFEDNSVDRLIATCLLVHLPDPEKALVEWRRVLSANGIATIFIPCEPGILLRLFRSISTVPKSRKLGFSHKSIHYREHRNMYIYCDMLIKEIFVNDQVKRIRFPIPFFPWNFRLFDLVIIRKNEI